MKKPASVAAGGVRAVDRSAFDLPHGQDGRGTLACSADFRSTEAFPSTFNLHVGKCVQRQGQNAPRGHVQASKPGRVQRRLNACARRLQAYDGNLRDMPLFDLPQDMIGAFGNLELDLRRRQINGNRHGLRRQDRQDALRDQGRIAEVSNVVNAHIDDGCERAGNYRVAKRRHAAVFMFATTKRVPEALPFRQPRCPSRNCEDARQPGPSHFQRLVKHRDFSGLEQS